MNVDHINSLHRRLAPWNLQTLCALCNHGKGGTAKDWRKDTGDRKDKVTSGTSTGKRDKSR